MAVLMATMNKRGLGKAKGRAPSPREGDSGPECFLLRARQHLSSLSGDIAHYVSHSDRPMMMHQAKKEKIY